MLGASRIHGTGHREAITVALEVVGDDVMARLPHLQFVVGVDPIFAGVHPFGLTPDGRSYKDTACCCYPFHMLGPADRRVTTIVMPAYLHPFHIVHEIGHALHETLDFDPWPEPTTDYAKSNKWEAFAEAFTSWCWPNPAYRRTDPATRALLNSL